MRAYLVPLSLLSLVLCVMCAATSARADVIFQLGNNPQPNEQAVLLTNGMTGVTVFGTTSVTGSLVSFSTVNDILEEFTTGVTGIRAQDNSINTITITVPGNTFSDFIANIFGVYAVHTEVDVVVQANDGTFPFSFTGLSDNQNNYLTIVATNGETIDSVTIDGKFFALRDPHVSGLSPTVPEPSSLMLLASGALGIAGRLLRRSR